MLVVDRCALGSSRRYLRLPRSCSRCRCWNDIGKQLTLPDAMPLEMRTVCERCGAALSQDGAAFICSYECTYCPECAAHMERRCPNCGGELVPRPIRVTR